MRGSALPGEVARRLVGIGERQGLDGASLLRRAGVTADLAHPSGRSRVTVEQAAELTRELWLLTGDELWGMGPPLPLGSFPLIMRSVIHVPDLRAALQRLTEASMALPGMPPIHVTVSETLVDIEIDVSGLDDPDHLGGEMLATVIHRMPGWLVGRRIALRELNLPWPEPPYAADYEIVFGLHPVFGAGRLAMAFDRRMLTAPLVRDEEQLADYLTDQPNVWFATRDYGTSTSDQVRRILARGLSGHWPTPDEIAVRLTVSTQHLRRLLRAEHTSIGQLKQDLLQEAAVASLSRGEESVEDLARRLGFSEASAFRRAFRRWTGKPPGAYRPPGRPAGGRTSESARE